MRLKPMIPMVFVLSLAVHGISCADDPPFPFDDAACIAAMNGADSRDAIEWLKDPYGGGRKVAGLDRDHSLALVFQIQGLGSEQIRAVGVQTAGGAEPYQSAQGFVVKLPSAGAQRKKLFELYAKDVREAGYSPRADTDQKYLMFGWRT